MSDTNKVSEEELKSITDLGVKYNTIRDNFGQLRIQRLLIEQQLEQIVENEDKLEQDYIETSRAKEPMQDIMSLPLQDFI